PLLVVVFWTKTLLFGDETLSRHHFEAENLLHFGDETFSRHHFKPKIARFWRRGPFSSSF
ncbi:hypothetical protein, partial [Caldifermentibacillus hisashii]|uniref:hypothetical protein n=1 Tax=Caldifermentibacillus hisashii TaxID=996558 RepID=UPI001B3567FB